MTKYDRDIVARLVQDNGITGVLYQLQVIAKDRRGKNGEWEFSFLDGAIENVLSGFRERVQNPEKRLKNHG